MRKQNRLLRKEISNFLGILFIALIPISTPLLVTPLNMSICYIGLALLFTGVIGIILVVLFSHKNISVLPLFYGVIVAVISLIYDYAYSNHQLEMWLSAIFAIALTIITIFLILYIYGTNNK